MIELGKGVGLRGAPVVTSKVMVRPPAAPNAPAFTVPVNVMEVAVNDVSPKEPELSEPELKVTLEIVTSKPLSWMTNVPVAENVPRRM
jgi:hypothetical protein